MSLSNLQETVGYISCKSVEGITSLDPIMPNIFAPRDNRSMAIDHQFKVSSVLYIVYKFIILMNIWIFMDIGHKE